MVLPKKGTVAAKIVAQRQKEGLPAKTTYTNPEYQKKLSAEQQRKTDYINITSPYNTAQTAARQVYLKHFFLEGQSSRDIIRDTSGGGVSKAFERQTPQEQKETLLREQLQNTIISPYGSVSKPYTEPQGFTMLPKKETPTTKPTPLTSTGMIKAASGTPSTDKYTKSFYEEEKKQKNPLFQILVSGKESFLGQGIEGSRIQRETAYSDLGRTLGASLGLGFWSNTTYLGITGAQAAGTAIRANTIYQAVTGNIFGKVTALTIGGYATSSAVYPAATNIARSLGTSKENVKYIKSSEGMQILGIATAKATGISPPNQYNEELRQFNEQKPILRQEIREYGRLQGLTGQELEDWTTKQTNIEFKNQALNYYVSQGYTQNEATRLANDIINNKKADTSGYLKLGNRYLSLSGVAGGISTAFINKDDFKKYAYQELINRGYSEQEAREKAKLLSKDLNYRAYGELAGLLSTEVTGELLGQGIFSSISQRNALKGIIVRPKEITAKLLGMGFISTAPAGAIEGGLSEVVQARARERPIQFKNILRNAGWGALSAGIVGSIAIGTSARHPTASKAATGFAYVTDPYEYVGDKIADFMSGSGSKAAVYSTEKLSHIYSFTPTLTQTTKANIPKMKVNTFTATLEPNSYTNINTIMSGTPTKSTVPILQNDIGSYSNIFSNIPTFNNVFSNVPTNTDTKTNTNISTKTSTNVNVPTDTNTPINTVITNLSHTNTPVNTNIPTNIPINIPTLTPIFRIPPPIPFSGSFDIPTGLGGFKNKKASKFINELLAGQMVTKSLLNVGSLGSFGFGLTKPKKAKKRK